MIAALLEKDIKLFFRNQFNLVITVLSLVVFTGAYLLLPDDVDQTLNVALYAEAGVPQSVIDRFTGPVEARIYETEEDLIDAVEDSKYSVGVVLRTASFSDGAGGTVPVYYAPGTADEVKGTFDNVLSSLLNAPQPGQPTPVRVSEQFEVIGPDFLEEPTPLRNRLLPALLLVIYAVEMMGLAGLIVEEIETQTARGLLTTPLSIAQFFTSKALMGVGLAVSQALFMLLVVGELFAAPLILLAVLLISSLFISGLAFLVAALSEDYMTVIGWSILFILALMIPALTLVAPGLGSAVVELIPSFYFIDTVHQAVNLEAGWADVTSNLLLLLAISIALLGLGGQLLRRRLS